MKINALYESVTNTITKEMETDGAPWAKRTPKVLSPLLLGEEANHYTRFCEKYERG
jgi:hypothetical protein